MQIAERSAGNVTVLDLSGQITFTKGDQLFKDKIHSLIHQGHKNILVNMGGVTHVDSAGLGELVGAYTTVTKAGGSMKLVNLTKRLTRPAGHHEAAHCLRHLRQRAGRADPTSTRTCASLSVPQHERRHIVVLGCAGRKRAHRRQESCSSRTSAA